MEYSWIHPLWLSNIQVNYYNIYNNNNSNNNNDDYNNNNNNNNIKNSINHNDSLTLDVLTLAYTKNAVAGGIFILLFHLVLFLHFYFLPEPSRPFLYSFPLFSSFMDSLLLSLSLLPLTLSSYPRSWTKIIASCLGTFTSLISPAFCCNSHHLLDMMMLYPFKL